jgi:hypothetical protein
LLIEFREHGEASNKVGAMQKSSTTLRGQRTAPYYFLRLRANEISLAFSWSKAAIGEKIPLARGCE